MYTRGLNGDDCECVSYVGRDLNITEESIEYNQTQSEQLEGDVKLIEARVDTNETNIALLDGRVTINSSNISTNTSNIQDNALDIDSLQLWTVAQGSINNAFNIEIDALDTRLTTAENDIVDTKFLTTSDAIVTLTDGSITGVVCQYSGVDPHTVYLPPSNVVDDGFQVTIKSMYNIVRVSRSDTTSGDRVERFDQFTSGYTVGYDLPLRTSAVFTLYYNTSQSRHIWALSSVFDYDRLISTRDTLADHTTDIAALQLEHSSGFDDPLLAPNGTVLLPGVGFKDDPDTGMYRIGSNDLGFSTAGLLRFEVKNTCNVSYSDLCIPDGTESAPGLSFTSNPGNGFYNVGSTMTVSADQNRVFSWSPTSTYVYNRLTVPNGMSTGVVSHSDSVTGDVTNPTYNLMTKVTASTFTMPPNAGVISGTIIIVKWDEASGGGTLATNGTDTINGTNTDISEVLPGSSFTLRSGGVSNNWTITAKYTEASKFVSLGNRFADYTWTKVSRIKTLHINATAANVTITLNTDEPAGMEYRLLSGGNAHNATLTLVDADSGDIILNGAATSSHTLGLFGVYNLVYSGANWWVSNGT